MIGRAVVLLLATLSLPAFAAEPFRCGTGPETDRRALAVRDFAGRDQRFAKAAAAAVPQRRDGMFTLEANPLATPLYDPIDLEGSSIVLKRNGTTYDVQRQPLQWESDAGSVLHRFSANSGTWHYKTYQLRYFAFPFFDANVSILYVSAFNGIFLAPPTPSQREQIGAVDAIADRTPMIAPMLLTDLAPLQFVQPTVWVRDTPSDVVFTWRVQGQDDDLLDMQVKIAVTGDITLSYRRVADLTWGAVVVTSGAEPWRNASTSLATGVDGSGDTHPSFSALVRPMLDIRSVELIRRGSLDLLELRIRTGANIDATLASAGTLQFMVGFDDNVQTLFQRGIYYEIRPDGNTWYMIAGTGGGPSPAARVDGDTVILQFLDSSVDLAAQRVYVYTSTAANENFADTATFTAPVSPALSHAELDLSELAQPLTGDRPLVEAFTLPAVNTYGVWDQLKAQYPTLRDDDVDAIAIYQTFYSDIMFYASAYSTGGNAGADGIAPADGYHGSTLKRETSLLHMNRFDYAMNTTLSRSSHVSLHEFGHRWLFFLQIREGAEDTYSLNPISAHPAQYVHTPAAFNVYGENESSVMGGAYFTDFGDGRFQSGDYESYGYSWLDLYLMGLAAPEEVPSFFYIRDSGLGGAYYPPPNEIVTGTRVDVNVGQVISAIGPRTPVAATSQKSFRVYFVLLTRPGQAPADEEMERMADHRRTFVTNFRKATGYRGDVVTVFEPQSGPRRRAVRR